MIKSRLKSSNKDISEDKQDDELDNSKHTDISLDSVEQLQQLLNEINDSCVEFLKNEDTDSALDQLKKAERILEDYTNDGKEVDRNMIIIVLYN